MATGFSVRMPPGPGILNPGGMQTRPAAKTQRITQPCEPRARGRAGIFIKFSCHRTISGNRSSGRWALAAAVVQDLGKMFEEDSRVIDFGAARLAHAKCQLDPSFPQETACLAGKVCRVPLQSLVDLDLTGGV